MNLFMREMSPTVITRLLSNAAAAEKRLADLRKELDRVRKQKVEEKVIQLSKENGQLRVKVEKAKNELIRLEVLNGKKQFVLPNRSITTTEGGNTEIRDIITTGVTKDTASKVVVKQEKVKEHPKKAKASTDTSAESVAVDVRKLDFRIGKIVDINKHPDADSLYVVKIDCGEGAPRTVVSGLVNYVPIEQMRDRLVMVLCNLKPVKMRGVTSEAMVMCASTPEKVEVLIPPAGSVPGDLVSCDGYPREPEALLNPKKKIFETCAPDLRTNDSAVACYKDAPLQVPGKGPIVAPTLKGVSVK